MDKKTELMYESYDVLEVAVDAFHETMQVIIKAKKSGDDPLGTITAVVEEQIEELENLLNALKKY